MGPVGKFFNKILRFRFCVLCFYISVVEGDTNVRLVGTTIPLEGRLEVYYKGEWGTVCNNGWTSPPRKNMDVVCRELGFTQGRAISTRYPGTGTTWLDGLICDGNEESIVDCPHKSWGDTSCLHSQDISVECDVCQQPIISSNTHLVQDWSFGATSYRETHPPKNARLKSAGSWCLHELRNMAFTHYLEVELPRLYLVSAVATLGGETVANYVKSYRLIYSVDGKEWENASVDGNQVIIGNSASGNENVVRRNLDDTIRVRFLRFVPLSWGSVACMRIEICGFQLPHHPTVLVNVKSSSIVATWSKPDSGDDAIKTYYIRYWKMKEGRSSNKMFDSKTALSVIVSNLSPFTDYVLEVSGVSDLGEGLSKGYVFKTLEAVPSGSPTAIQSTILSATAVNITWAPPEEDKRNGVITEYVVCFPQDGNADGVCADRILVPGSQTWYVLRDVDVSVERVVEIRAKTAVGTGPSAKGTSGILEYTSPEGVASSVVIAAIFGAIMLTLIMIVILATKGIILKNFVHALRKLTSSQITIHSENSQEDKETKQGTNNEDPEPSPDNPEITAADLYNTNTAGQHTEVVYETFADVRRVTMELVKEEDIYGYRNGISHVPEEPLYESRDQVVYVARDQNAASIGVPLPQHQDATQIVENSRVQHEINIIISSPQPSHENFLIDGTSPQYDHVSELVDLSLPEQRDQAEDENTEYNPYDQNEDTGYNPYDQNDATGYNPYDQNFESLSILLQEEEQKMTEPNQDDHSAIISLQHLEDDDEFAGTIYDQGTGSVASFEQLNEEYESTEETNDEEHDQDSNCVSIPFPNQQNQVDQTMDDQMMYNTSRSMEYSFPRPRQ